MEKTEPFVYMLSTVISPPIRSISCLQIDRPSPVPSILLISELSAREKLSKMRSITSFFMPIPVSATETVILHLLSDILSALAVSVTLPSFVYLAAFTRIFKSTCFILLGSPHKTDGSVCSIFT